MVLLTVDQKNSLKTILDWFNEGTKSHKTLGGYAGTGKTTLIAVLSKLLKMQDKSLKIAFCSYTGKSTQVIKSKLIESNAVAKKDKISTIHALIYEPILNQAQQIIGWNRVSEDKVKYDLIVVDEASMVDSRIWADLKSFNIPILAVGDHGQLPPISGEFNLMKKPDLILTEIHRQARDNPIIKLSIEARKKGKIRAGTHSSNVIKYSLSDYQYTDLVSEVLSTYNKDTLVLCAYNKTRVQINNLIREHLGFFEPTPQVGDRVICLRNNHKKAIFNGMIGEIEDIKNNNDYAEPAYEVTIKMDDTQSIYTGVIYANQFNEPNSINFTRERKKIKDMDLFDFGYALTVHKAQGSEASRVILVEQRSPKMSDEEWRRWLYTGVTRASDSLIIFGHD